MQEELIDRIYECSVVPELWPDVLDELAELTDSIGGMLFSARKAVNWTATESVFDAFDTYVKDGWFEKCPRRTCMMGKSEPTFFVEQDFFSEEELANNPFYRDFFHPRNLGWSAGTLLQMPTGDNIVFSIERHLDQGPIERDHVDRLNDLRPHLLRSAFVSTRLGLQRAQGASETLSKFGLPALVLDARGKFVEANERAKSVTDHVKFNEVGRDVAFSDRRATAFLTSAMETLDRVVSTDNLSFPVRNEDGNAVFVGHVMPIKLAAHDIFANSYALLFFTPLDQTRAPSTALMRSLFDMTVAETRIAKGLMKGQTLTEIAADGSVSITTVRSQFSSVLEKTGCGRQAELVGLLANIAIAQNGEVQNS
ncbi:MAG: helix-turn-helix transcriptional regulator [Sphingomonadales bacterium]|nr:helix-turn-helix transcriptional regulator [Sphingomonadales bacterium]PIX67459.1 MAG: helix-turn-helix transcriptional regulator [Sphingomonadales bacterium CG_4_10_14_3_um_filter_58_15]NCO48093.1 helix-turn-helix transcriptional regulator [Sphingomonadales bacterium]NCO99663.1 helix-turn-helix transcriptional regulator [Sphingomonadales bacterium]NCP25451.1 helix-turn-helix transcriptional regulator [Sphingomonadales bacterium]